MSVVDGDNDGIVRIDIGAIKAPLPLPGDYNHNNEVDAADFVLWNAGAPMSGDSARLTVMAAGSWTKMITACGGAVRADTDYDGNRQRSEHSCRARSPTSSMEASGRQASVILFLPGPTESRCQAQRIGEQRSTSQRENPPPCLNVGGPLLLVPGQLSAPRMAKLLRLPRADAMKRS